MFSRETWSAIFFIAVTAINLATLFRLNAEGALSTGEFFIGMMVWFYGTIIIVDHLWFDNEDDDGGDDDYAG